MADRFHVHVPLARLEEFLPTLRELKLPVELAIKGPDLDRLETFPLGQLQTLLASDSLGLSIHAPFLDLSPGSPDPLIQQATHHRFEQTFAVAARLNAHTVVIHPGYDRWRFGSKKDLWLQSCLRFWHPFVESCAQRGLRLVFENIFEEDPETLLALIKGLDASHVGHCFDIGHWHLFGHTSMEQWFEALGDDLLHVHLHDNYGEDDNHLPVGEGSIDFSLFVRLCHALKRQPTFTLEAHAIDTLHRSLSACRSLFAVSAD